MGTHPIFESDFDCLTDSEKMPKDESADGEEENSTEVTSLTAHAMAERIIRIVDPSDCRTDGSMICSTGIREETRRGNGTPDTGLSDGIIAAIRPHSRN